MVVMSSVTSATVGQVFVKIPNKLLKSGMIVNNKGLPLGANRARQIARSLTLLFPTFAG